MTKEIVYTKNAPAPIGPYSQAIKIKLGDITLIFSSGQVALDPQTGSFFEGGIKEQTKHTLENIRAVLNEAGTDLSKVIKTTVFLKDMNDFTAMNEIYAEYFNVSKPARSTVQVGRLPKDALVEIEVLAHL